MGFEEETDNGADRRRDARFDRSFPLTVGQDGLRAESINISARGLYCKVTRYVEPFSKLKVAMELPLVERGYETLECDGVVVRVEPECEPAAGGEYCLAIYFLNLDRDGAQLIEQFLAENH